MKLLDDSGLSYFYNKIKTIFASKSEIPTKTSQLTNDSNYNYSREANGTSGTIDGLASLTSGKPGMTGSISLAKKSSGIGSEIPAGWYNFYFAPHRTGVGGDNISYGTILLFPMNFAGKSWILRRSNSTNAITEVKEIITADRLSGYIANSGTYINTHPENSPVLIPFIHNDIAFMLKRGGSVKIYYDNVETSLDLSNVFDGSPSYWAINPTGTTEIVIELTLHKVFAWTNTIYCDFGSAGWRAKSVKIDVINTNYAQDVWTQKYITTANGLGNVKVTTQHTPVGASNGGGGFNKVRFTFSNWNSATIFRIAQLGIYNYGSLGVRETSMSRGIDDYIFRSITPNSNNTYNLGSSTNKWANVYATTFNGNATSATKATGDKNGADITTTYYKASNPNGYTSNTGTITGVSVNGTSVATSGVANITSLPASILDGEINNGVTATTQTNGDNSKKVATTAYVDNAVNNVRGSETPLGTILAFAGTNAPTGYLICNGNAVSRTTYAGLYSVIGDTYGAGDGSSTFNVPDLKGKVIVGLDIVDKDFNVLGKTGGAKSVQLTKNNLPHISGSFTMHGAGSSTPVSSVSGDFTSNYNNTKYKNGGIEVSGAGSKGKVTLDIGNDEAHENKQPYNTLNYIIKAYSGTDPLIPVASSQVKNSYDSSTGNVYSTEYINTKVKGAKLWENLNPTSNFSAQTITFNETNDYDFYKIKVQYLAGNNGAHPIWQDVKVGDGFRLLYMSSYTPDLANPNAKGYIGTAFRPACTCNHQSITFTSAYHYLTEHSTKDVNVTNYCIPLEIYGYYI